MTSEEKSHCQSIYMKGTG